jgi:hypothetical protein
MRDLPEPLAISERQLSVCRFAHGVGNCVGLADAFVFVHFKLLPVDRRPGERLNDYVGGHG